jgi:hypothetical protein
MLPDKPELSRPLADPALASRIAEACSQIPFGLTERDKKRHLILVGDPAAVPATAYSHAEPSPSRSRCGP